MHFAVFVLCSFVKCDNSIEIDLNIIVNVKTYKLLTIKVVKYSGKTEIMAKTQIGNLQLELKNKRICRFCLSQNEPLTNIYSEDDSLNTSTPLAVQVMACASIEVFINDGMPKTVCGTCRVFIEHYYRFNQMCKKADTVLKEYPFTVTWSQPLDIPKIPEEFILKQHPKLLRAPKTESISSSTKNNNSQPAPAPKPAAQSSGVTQKSQANPTGRKPLNKNSNSIYQFKIVLMEYKPRIWRRIQVPSKYSFWDLHVAIQDAMGWQDKHLHKFEVFNPQTGDIDEIGIPDESEKDDDTIPERTVKLSKYFSCAKEKGSYEYDFGDGWQHEITLEKILPAVEGVKYPQCIEGEMACPPEDSGGVWKYENLVKVIANPKHKEYAESKDWLEWIGQSDFNPVEFDPKDVIFDDPEERWKIADNNGIYRFAVDMCGKMFRKMMKEQCQ